MSIGFTFSACSLFYSILLTIIYFSKKRLHSLENKIYSYTIITNLIGVIFALLCYFSILNKDIYPFLNSFVSKGLLIYYLTYIMLLSLYIYIISYKIDSKIGLALERKEKTFFYIVGFIYVICTIFCIVLPLYYFSSGNVAYSYGPSANLVYIVSGIAITFWLILMFKNIKGIKNKKYLPLFSFILIGAVVIIIQKLNPGILLMTSMETFVTFLMYFTIENPDMKIIGELNIARDQAEKANNAKSDFLSNMSHEIRTPLNAIVGFSQILSDDQTVPEAAKDEIKDIIMASQNLLEIVNGILDISKIEANKLEIINTEYNFNKILDELVTLTKGRLGDKPLILETNFDQSIPTILFGDHTRLKQIVLNLLTNAVKYTKEGTIQFNVSSVIKDDVCRLIIAVEDTGMGIKKENIDKLFTKFERFDMKHNTTIEGTGLGLAITKKLVELMNGQIVVQSEYGIGSKFTVAIDQKIVLNPTKINGNQEEVMSSVFDASDKRILIVDDNKINLKVASRLLQSYQIEIDQALSGKECIDKVLSDQKYDLILLDDMMPVMSGVETLRELQKIPGFITPVVAFTANAISGMKEKYLNDGFSGYLSKPVDKMELNIVLNMFLKEKEK